MERPPHRRKNTRAIAFDYAEPGAYFVTIVIKDRRLLLGSISADGNHHLSAAGHMVLNAWLDIPITEPWAACDECVIMPDHLHGILMLGSTPSNTESTSLGKIIGRFKTMTTTFYGIGVRQEGWPPYDAKLWQLNYYDRIIRNGTELDRIRAYILDNPARWARQRDSKVGQDGA